MGNTDIVGDVHGRLIVFDLDGTLVDSQLDLADATNELIAELGGLPLPTDAVARMVGEGARVLVERALRASGLEGEAEGLSLSRRLQRFLEIYDTRLLLHTKPYPGVEDALEGARGRARLAILTNKPARATLAVLEGLRLRSFFEEVIGGDGTWPRKPDPAGLQHLMAAAGATPRRALLVGDSVVDHETAARGGVTCCLAAYGFGYAMFPVERLRPGDLLVHEPQELSIVLDRWITNSETSR